MIKGHCVAERIDDRLLEEGDTKIRVQGSNPEIDPSMESISISIKGISVNISKNNQGETIVKVDLPDGEEGNSRYFQSILGQNDYFIVTHVK